MAKCKECAAEMKPLFSGEYCPNDCDKPEVLAKRREYEAAAKKLAENNITPSTVWGLGAWIPVTTFNLKTLPATGTITFLLQWAAT